MTKRKVGRPSAYKIEHCVAVIELGRKGKSKAQIAATLDVRRQTLDNWAREHPEFLDAITRARELSLAWWEDRGQEGISDKSFNTQAWGLQVRNRFPESYKDKTDHHHTGNVVTHTKPFDKMTAEEMAAAYARKKDAFPGRKS